MRIIQLAHQTPTQMMGYILQADDGTLCCIDGGMPGDTDHLLARLRMLGGPKPHIKYWFFTHAHRDHCSAFLQLWPRRDMDFTLENVVYTFPDADTILRHDPRTGEIPYEFLRYGVPHREPRAGDRFLLGSGSVMEVLQTWDPDETMNMTNNSSTVYRLHTDGMCAVFPGDLGVEAGRRLLNTYGNSLKCHILQMAHHGQNGMGREVYRALNPDICLWPTPRWLWSNTRHDQYPGKGPWATLHTRQWMAEMGDQIHVVAQYGTWELMLQNGKAEIRLLDKYCGDRLL